MTRHAILIGHFDGSDFCPELERYKDFLTSEAGGAWREDEITLIEPLAWDEAQFLLSRLRQYDRVLVYNTTDEGWGKALRVLAEEGRGEYVESQIQLGIQNEELRIGRAGFDAARLAGTGGRTGSGAAGL